MRISNSSILNNTNTTGISVLVTKAFPYDDLLVSLDRPVYLPLVEWTVFVRDTFARYKPQPDATVCEAATYAAMIGCYNQAGLIEVCFGRLNEALRICEAGMCWAAK